MFLFPPPPLSVLIFGFAGQTVKPNEKRQVTLDLKVGLRARNGQS